MPYEPLVFPDREHDEVFDFYSGVCGLRLADPKIASGYVDVVKREWQAECPACGADTPQFKTMTL